MTQNELRSVVHEVPGPIDHARHRFELEWRDREAMLAMHVLAMRKGLKLDLTGRVVAAIFYRPTFPCELGEALLLIEVLA